MKIAETALPGVLKLKTRRLTDSRGWFSETWSAATCARGGIDAIFVQDNQSCSATSGTVRGLHYQRPPAAQGKLVRVARGRIRDVAVDVRVGSAHYGRWVAEELSAENGWQLWVPRGFLHGFATLEPDTEVIYKVDAPYARNCEGAVRFDDPDLAIDWGVDPVRAVVSDRDARAAPFRDFASPFVEGAAW